MILKVLFPFVAFNFVLSVYARRIPRELGDCFLSTGDVRLCMEFFYVLQRNGNSGLFQNTVEPSWNPFKDTLSFLMWNNLINSDASLWDIIHAKPPTITRRYRPSIVDPRTSASNPFIPDTQVKFTPEFTAPVISRRFKPSVIDPRTLQKDQTSSASNTPVQPNHNVKYQISPEFIDPRTLFTPPKIDSPFKASIVDARTLPNIVDAVALNIKNPLQ